MFRLLLSLALLTPLAARAAEPAARPNIVIIYADDIGYGDLSCYGAAKVKTPNLDRLAGQGLRFTDGHAASATCTPSRYALLTGQYAWRKAGTGILPGDAGLIIPPGTATLPGMLKGAGYTTGVVGKWHLGLGVGKEKTDWNGVIRPGPREIGFDYSFLIPATGDRVPCVYVEDQQVVGLDPADPIRVSYGQKVGDEPTGRSHPELLKMGLTLGHDNTIVNGISRIGFMTGGKAARWKDEEMADVITARATRFIERNKDRPFFLFFATHDIHVPRVPHPRFVGTSQCGTRGDVIHQLDWSVGQVIGTLERLGLKDDTLVIFSSDNGPVLDDGYADGAVKDLSGHEPAGALKGKKYSLYEAGTRVPFIVSWPRRAKPGLSDALVCQIDWFHSLAALTGQKLSDDAAPDSFNVLPALLGEAKDGREHLIEHANGIALRKGHWKLIPNMPLAGVVNRRPVNPANARGPELYDLTDDLGEMKNLVKEQPERVEEMMGLIQDLARRQRTRP